jgi:hypothetical protein
VAEQGKALGARLVVAIHAAQMMDELSIHLELIDCASAELLGDETSMVPAAARSLPDEPFGLFAARVATALAKAAPPPPPDAPVAEATAEERPSPPPEAPPPPSPAEAPAAQLVAHASSARAPWVWAPGAAGVVLVAAGTYFAINANSEAQQLWNLQPATTADARALASQATQDRALGAVFLGAGVAGFAATWLLYRATAPDEAPTVSLIPSGQGWQFTAEGRWR